MTVSDTPRTEQAAFFGESSDVINVVAIDFVRQLERELVAMTAARDKAVGALKQCRNHLSGDPTFGACPLGLDELIAELEEVK